MRWTNTFRLDKGKYRFITETDDGVRLYINDRPSSTSGRRSHAASTLTRRRSTAATTVIRMEYFDEGGCGVPACAPRCSRRAAAPSATSSPACRRSRRITWIKLYRLDGNNQWYFAGQGIGSVSAPGFLKIDGLPVDENRFGGAGEPPTRWSSGSTARWRATGDFQRGRADLPRRAFADNVTPWSCSP